MKILYYNWHDFEARDAKGGGVSVYQRNLIEASLARGDEPWFLSSGTEYSLQRREPRVRRVRGVDSRVHKFTLTDSPIAAPAADAQLPGTLEHAEMEHLFAAFLREHGPFDAIHFNTLEGIPLSLLRTARSRGVRVVVSLHNYFPFCPEVNLWFQGHVACGDHDQGRRCVSCVAARPHPGHVRRAHARRTLLRKLRIDEQGTVLRTLTTLARRLRKARTASASPPIGNSPHDASFFEHRRRAYVAALNRDADCVLAVSGRVAALAQDFGIRHDKLRVAYIGTRFGALEPPTPRPWHPGAGPLTIAFLGYMARHKGFYFLLDALEAMPPQLSARLAVVLAMKAEDGEAVARVQRLASRFASVRLVDGYTHATLPQLLADVHLGIVPVLWEDNLPQVAVEMVAHGVPILTSDLGGAQELLRCADLTFQAGSIADFLAKLQGVLARPDILAAALTQRQPLLTPQQHYDYLRSQVYADAR